MPVTASTWLAEQKVNTTDTGTTAGFDDQYNADVVGLSNGGFVVAFRDNSVWSGSGDDSNDVRFQVYDALGATVGTEQSMTSWFADSEYDVQLASYDDGFVAVFMDYRSSTGTYDIRAERKDNDGNHVSTVTVKSDPGGSAVLNSVRVDAQSDGSFTVTYDEIDGADSDVKGVTVEANNTVGTEFTLRSDATADDPMDGDVAVLSNGNIVTVFEETDGDVDLEHKIVQADGTLVTTANITSNATTDGSPRVTGLEGGGFVVTWQEDGGNLYHAVYENDGSVRLAPTELYPGSAIFQEMSVAATKDGGYAILFEDETFDKAWISVFNSSGVDQGFFNFADGTTEFSEISNIAALDDGRLAVTFEKSTGGNLDTWVEVFDVRSSTISGDATDEVITGRQDGSTIDAGAGDDTVYAVDGDDTINDTDGLLTSDVYDGGNGTDTLDYSSIAWVGGGAVTFDMVNGEARLYGAVSDTFTNIENMNVGGSAWVIGDSNDNVINGAGGENNIDMSAGGTNTVNAGSGDDTITSSGDGYYNAEGGDDLVYAGLTSTVEELDGGSGTDTLDVTSFNATYSVNLTTGVTNYTGIAGEMFTNFENIVMGNGVNTVWGTTGANELTGGTDMDTLRAGAGNDIVNGGDGNDLLDGGGDNDTLGGGAGDDEIYGRSGNDSIDGWTGVDLIYGGGGDDFITGWDGNDDLNGQSGVDILYGEAGDDRIVGGGGDDELYGGAGADFLNGAQNADLMRGGDDNDDLYGNNQGDTMFGDAGDDRLFGQQGIDRLDGGAGTDILNGGTQRDTLVFGVGYENDTVTGFEDNIDTIEFDDALWGGGLSVADVISTYAYASGAHTIFDFGGGDMLRIFNAAPADFNNDINIV